MRRIWNLLASVVVSAALMAADSGLQGPSTGFVLDPRSHSIRPIQGLPGSSTLGPAVDLPFAVDRAVFSGQGDLALVFGGGIVSLVRRMRDASPEVVPLAITIPESDAAVWNPAGSAALFYSRSKRQMQVVSGLREVPAAGPVIDGSALAGSMVSAALDGSGTSVLAGTANEGGGCLWLLRPDSTGAFVAVEVLSAHVASSVLFLNQDRDALVADAKADQVLLIGDVNGAATISVVARSDDGIDKPAGIQLSADGKSVLVANSGSSSITVHALDGSTPVTQVPVPVAPTCFGRLNSEPVFIFDDSMSGPLYLLDEAGGRRVYFVPLG